MSNFHEAETLSVDEVIAWIADKAPGEMADSSDDEGIDGFGCSDPCGPTRPLEPFDA
jgi:hypothetical protein